MHPFAFAHPATLGETIALLDRHGADARLLAGGTDLIIRLRDGSLRPAVVAGILIIALGRSISAHSRRAAASVPAASSARLGETSKLTKPALPALCSWIGWNNSQALRTSGRTSVSKRCSGSGAPCLSSAAAAW